MAVAPKALWALSQTASCPTGGKVTGIIPKFLMNKEATEHALGQLSELIVTEDMHERKHKMFERSDAFVTLPGGIGTVEEIVEIMTWAQLGRHRKPMVFANINGFWNPMLALIDHMKAEGFVHTSHLVNPIVIEKPEDIVPAILNAAARGRPRRRRSHHRTALANEGISRLNMLDPENKNSHDDDFVIEHGFDADGTLLPTRRCRNAAWVWKGYALADARARRCLETDDKPAGGRA